MALEKVQIVDKIEVVENGCVQILTKTVILENGQQISGSFQRHIIAPGDDYAEEDVRVKAICSATHTADVIAAYQAAIAAKGV